ncbi:MAG: EAL domain-containing protein [Pseudolabrys sp.]
MFRRADNYAGWIAQHFIADVRALLRPKSDDPARAVLNNDWFELWYQPKIELKSLHLIGAEAWVCARHPTRGIVPPAMFLPGAGGDAMHALTERVILTALGDWKDFAWRADSTLGQRAGVGFGRSANSPDAARGSPACRELAGFDPWRLLKTRSFTICSWRKTLPKRCGNSNATSRSTISVQDTRHLSA